jgi:uncharacterized protein (TIGR00369 family)
MRMQPPDDAYDARIRASFARQAFMTTLGARIVRVEPGHVVLELPFSAALTQQHGTLHAGATTAVVDSACGYAALTLMPTSADVVSVEFKVNLLAPGKGARFRAMGRVLRAGKTLTVCQGELVALQVGDTDDSPGVVVAVMQATMMAVAPRPA